MDQMKYLTYFLQAYFNHNLESSETFMENVLKEFWQEDKACKSGLASDIKLALARGLIPSDLRSAYLDPEWTQFDRIMTVDEAKFVLRALETELGH